MDPAAAVGLFKFNESPAAKDAVCAPSTLVTCTSVLVEPLVSRNN